MRRFIAITLSVVCLCLLAACGAPSTDMNNPGIQYEGLIDDSSTAYVLCEKKGTSIAIPNARQAFVTGDRKALVWVSADNDLNYVAFNEEKTDLTKAEKMADDVSSIVHFNDAGLCYQDNSKDLYLLRFADKTSTFIANKADPVCFEENLDVVYAKKHEVYYLSHDSKDAEKIGSYDNRKVRLYSQSTADANRIFWIDINLSSKTDTVYCYDAKGVQKAAEFHNNEYDRATTIKTIGNYALGYSLYDSSLILLNEGGDIVKVDFSGNITLVFPDYRVLSSNDKGDLNGLYVMIESDNSYSLYWISLSGDKEKLMSDIKSFCVSGETLFYLTADKRLYKTAANGIETSEGEQVDSEVDAMDVSNDSGIVFYMKDGEETAGSSYNAAGTLYAYKATDEGPTKIDSNVFMTLFSSFDSAFCNFDLLDLGSSVLYVKNPEVHNHSVFGSLYLYKYGEEEPVLILSDVKEHPIRYTKVNPSSDSFIFARYIDEESQESSYYDWYYYNGKEALPFAMHCLYNED